MGAGASASEQTLLADARASGATQEEIDLCVKRGGSIVNIASLATVRFVSNISPYAGSKAAIAFSIDARPKTYPSSSSSLASPSDAQSSRMSNKSSRRFSLRRPSAVARARSAPSPPCRATTTRRRASGRAAG